MRWIYVLAVSWLALVLPSCNEDKEKARKLDHDIVSTNDSLLKLGLRWGEVLKVVYDSGSFQELAPVRKNMETYVVDKLNFIGNVEMVNGAEAYVTKEREFLQFENRVIRNELRQFEDFGDSTAADIVQRALEDLNKVTMEEQDRLSGIDVERRAFLNKYGLKADSR